MIQNYYDYLPVREDQQLLLLSSKIGWKHDRMALTFNFPETCQAKLVQVQPFFDNNNLTLSIKES